ncbi:subunit of the GINS complex [Globomyces pollinis-pini]|nr:subunit of the GINS complex [Globomyces pollinis-pini]
MSGRSFYCDEALKLIQECQRTKDSPNIPIYQEDLIRSILLESNHLVNQSTKYLNSKTLNFTCLDRNKRLVLAYQRHRLDRFRELLWNVGANSNSILPTQCQSSTSNFEAKFIKDYLDLVTHYKGCFLDIDLGSSMIPPKDIFIEIRVIHDCGEIMTDMGPIVLAAGTQHYLKRTDVDDLITMGDVIHLP